MNFKHLAVATVIAAGSLQAQAVPNLVADWGSHNLAGETFNGQQTSGVFDDIITFSLSSPYVTSAAAVSLSFLSYLNISDGVVQLFSSNGNVDYTDDSFVQSFTFSSFSTGTNFGTLGTGNYFYRVQGNANGSLGGSYLLGSAIAPVPEPGTYALILAGLGVVGFVAKRRMPRQ